MALSLWFGGDAEPDLPAVKAVVVGPWPVGEEVPLQAFSGGSVVVPTLDTASGPVLDAVSLYATAFVPVALEGSRLAEGEIVVLSLEALVRELRPLASVSESAAAWLDIAGRALSARRVLWLA